MKKIIIMTTVVAVILTCATYFYYHVYSKNNIASEEQILSMFKNERENFTAVSDYLIKFNKDVRISKYNGSINVIDKNFQDVPIEKDLEGTLNNLFLKCNSLSIRYSSKHKEILYRLNGKVKPKGIAYLLDSTKETLENEFITFDFYKHIEGNWYYYEGMPGT